MNAAAWGTISARFEARYIGPINPPISLEEKTISKALRLVGGRGDYFFFSDRRLRVIANEVSAACASPARLDFFHGFTPWIMTKPKRPYVAWSDCTFADYINVYHDPAHFRDGSLLRIERLEAEWMQCAYRVAFTTVWAAERAIKKYAIDPRKAVVVGIFGEVDEPERDTYDESNRFTFVSTNFEAKGGPTLLAAFRLVRDKHPGVHLTIVGDRPVQLSKEPGVEMTGYLRKEDAEQCRRFREILASSRAIVHPTRSDIAPLLIVEAGYFGCPVIASNRYAIPELVDHGKSGLLLDNPSNPEQVAGAMCWMLEDATAYRAMRSTVWARVRERNRRQQFDERLRACVDTA
jgi:glycosyltransferase involved in cell wall biosynthesis